MKAKIFILLVLVTMTMTAVLVAGCTSPSAAPTATPGTAATAMTSATATAAATANPTAAPILEPTIGARPVVALTINGSVSTPVPLELALAQLQALPSISVNENGVSGSGPSLNGLIDGTKPISSATRVTFTSADGTSKTVSLASVQNDANATLVISDDGSLRPVIHGVSSDNWVRNLVLITIN